LHISKLLLHLHSNQYTMTLTEYLNQADPHRMPNVVLDKTEYTIASSINIPNKGKLSLVYITDPEAKILWGIEYVKWDNDTTLYTTDADGNPKKRSCFSTK